MKQRGQTAILDTALVRKGTRILVLSLIDNSTPDQALLKSFVAKATDKL